MSPAVLVPGLALLLGAGTAHDLEDVPWVDLAGRSELRSVVDRERERREDGGR